MSEPTIPQKPPFEETEAYKSLRASFAEMVTNCFVEQEEKIQVRLQGDNHHLADDIRAIEHRAWWACREAYELHKKSLAHLHQRYDRGEL